MASKKVDLVNLFQTVSGVLADNKTALNQADDYNHNHGDNMVEIFEVITEAMKKKPNASAAVQLDYASKLLSQKTNSGSAQLYTQGLAKAATQYKGKQIKPQNAMDLITSLMGSAQPAQQSAGAASDPLGGMLGSMLGGLLGGETTQPAQAPADSGLDVSDLLQAGMSFMQAKQQGGSTADALIGALMSSSQMASAPHRQQSGTLVASTLLQMLGGMTGK